MPIDRDLGRHVLYALRHLYDPDALRQSPLADRLNVPQDGDSAAALRHLLRDAIRSMRPDDDVPPDTRARRDYQVLYYRYVQGCNQVEVADQVGLSVRQLRREEQRAVITLARRLYDVLGSQPLAHEGDDLATANSVGINPAVANELAWLADAKAEEPCDLSHTLDAVLELAAPIAAKHDVKMICPAPSSACLVAADTVATRQILLVVLTIAIRHAKGGQVHVSLRDRHQVVETVFEVKGPSGGQSQVLNGEDREGLKIVRHLLDACGGKLCLPDDSEYLQLVAQFPTVKQIPVLVIEDNADTVRLLERFLLGTRFHLHSVSRVEEALSVASRITPRIIILDIVMPDIDGWEWLQRLQRHPATQDVPVLVCTILPERELALSLGAAEFLHKPFRRLVLRQALEELAGREEKAPRLLPESH
jgi:CheY-like chemotaxis protein